MHLASDCILIFVVGSHLVFPVGSLVWVRGQLEYCQEMLTDSQDVGGGGGVDHHLLAHACAGQV